MESPYLPSAWPWIACLQPSLVGGLALWLARSRPRWAFWTAHLGLWLGLLLTVLTAGQVYRQNKILTAWGSHLYVDGLSALVMLLGAALVALVALYSLRSSRLSQQTGGRSLHPGWFAFLLGLANWTCAANNIALLFLALTLTVLATPFLRGADPAAQAGSLRADWRHLRWMAAGMVLVLIGLILIYAAVAHTPGSPHRKLLLLTLLSRYVKIIPSGVALSAVVLLVIGLGAQAGLPPLCVGLIGAQAQACPVGGALLAGLLTKMGTYLLTRVLGIYAPHFPALPLFVGTLACVGMMGGILLALAQDDLKRTLAYVGISQMGFVAAGLGLGTHAGIYAGLFHLINHGLLMALLFLVAGSVIHLTGKQRLSDAWVPVRRAPVTAYCFALGGMAISGLPPFGTFRSQIVLFQATIQDGFLWVAMTSLLTNVLALLCLARASYRLFWRRPSGPGEEGGVAQEAPALLLAPLVILTVAALLLGWGSPTPLLHPLLERSCRCLLDMMGVR